MSNQLFYDFERYGGDICTHDRGLHHVKRISHACHYDLGGNVIVFKNRNHIFDQIHTHMAGVVQSAAGPQGSACAEASTERLGIATALPESAAARDDAQDAEAPAPAARPVAAALGAAIRAYQVLFSSQDKPSCQFVPSCSNYCLQAIRHRGFLLGAMMCSDRVMRCHPGVAPYHPRDETTGRAIDFPY